MARATTATAATVLVIAMMMCGYAHAQTAVVSQMILPFKEGLTVGSAINMQTGNVPGGTALMFNRTTYPDIVSFTQWLEKGANPLPIPDLQYKVRLVESRKDVQDELDINGAFALDVVGFIKGSAQGQMLKLDYKSTSDVFVEVHITSRTEQIKLPLENDYALHVRPTLNPVTFDLGERATEGADVGAGFRSQFGTGFVSGVVYGGELYAMMKFKGLDAEEVDKTEVDVTGELNQGAITGEAAVSYLDSLTSKVSNLEQEIKFFATGGVTPGVLPSNVNELMKVISEWPKSVEDKPAPLRLIVDPYVNIPLFREWAGVDLPAPDVDKSIQDSFVDFYYDFQNIENQIEDTLDDSEDLRLSEEVQDKLIDMLSEVDNKTISIIEVFENPGRDRTELLRMKKTLRKSESSPRKLEIRIDALLNDDAISRYYTKGAGHIAAERGQLVTFPSSKVRGPIERDGNGGVVNATAGQCASACEISIDCNSFEYNPALRACALRQNASWPTVHLPEEGWQTFWHIGMTFPVPQRESLVFRKDLPDTLGEYKSDQERLARLEQKLDGVVSDDNKWIDDPTGLKFVSGDFALGRCLLGWASSILFGHNGPPPCPEGYCYEGTVETSRSSDPWNWRTYYMCCEAETVQRESATGNERKC